MLADRLDQRRIIAIGDFVTAGGVIQFCGLKPPVSACTITDPSDLSMSSRSASGSTSARVRATGQSS